MIENARQTSVPSSSTTSEKAQCTGSNTGNRGIKRANCIPTRSRLEECMCTFAIDRFSESRAPLVFTFSRGLKKERIIWSLFPPFVKFVSAPSREIETENPRGKNWRMDPWRTMSNVEEKGTGTQVEQNGERKEKRNKNVQHLTAFKKGKLFSSLFNPFCPDKKMS